MDQIRTFRLNKQHGEDLLNKTKSFDNLCIPDSKPAQGSESYDSTDFLPEQKHQTLGSDLHTPEMLDAPQQVEANFASSAESCVDCYMFGQPITCCADSGAHRNIMSYKTILELMIDQKQCTNVRFSK